MNNIKLTQLVLFVTLFIFQKGLAQELNNEASDLNDDAKTSIKIGAKIGYSLAKLHDSNKNTYAKDYESDSGIDFGFTAEFILTNTFSIQTELNYTQRNGTRTGMQPLGENGLSEQLNQFLPFLGLSTITPENPIYAYFEAEQKLNYLEVPVLAKFGWGDDFRFYGEVGPYVGILLCAKQHTSGESQFYFDEDGNNPVFVPISDDLSEFIVLPAQSLDAETDIEDDLKTVNFGGIVGIGVIKKLGEKSEVYLDARASYTFNYIQLRNVYGETNVGGVIISLGYVYSIQ